MSHKWFPSVMNFFWRAFGLYKYELWLNLLFLLLTWSLKSVFLFAIKILVTFAIFAKFLDFALFASLLYKSDLLVKNVILAIVSNCCCCCWRKFLSLLRFLRNLQISRGPFLTYLFLYKCELLLTLLFLIFLRYSSVCFCCNEISCFFFCDFCRLL